MDGWPLPDPRAGPHMAIITTMNSTATRIVRFCYPVRASPVPPPISSITAATAPVTTPQKTTTGRIGSKVPFSDTCQPFKGPYLHLPYPLPPTTRGQTCRGVAAVT